MDYQTSLWESLLHPRIWASILLFLLYTGAELTLGNWTYTLFTEGRGISPQIAGIWAGGFWATFTLGRVMGGLYADRVRLDRLMIGAMSLALAGSILFWWNPLPSVGVLGVFVVGFAMAPVFPGLISSTSRRVGEQHAANTIGIQVSAAGLGGGRCCRRWPACWPGGSRSKPSRSCYLFHWSGYSSCICSQHGQADCIRDSLAKHRVF